MSFWGVHLKPNEPYTLPHNQNQNGDDKKQLLRITQATLGDAIRFSPVSSTVYCSIGDNPGIAICSLCVRNLTCCQLDLEFHESHDVIFSVKGPRGIHLAGYFVTPAADHLRLLNDGNEAPNGDEVQEKTQCEPLQENGDAIVKKKKRNKKNKKKKANTIGPTAGGYVSDTKSEMVEARLTKTSGFANALKRSEDKVKAKMEASTTEPMGSGYVNATEDDKFGSESRINKENGSANALERGQDKEEKKNRKRKASTIESTTSGYVNPSEDDKFGSSNAIEISEGTEEKKKKKKKSRSKKHLSLDKNPSMGDMNEDSPSLTIEGQLPEMSKTILVECEVNGAGAKSK